MLADLRYALRSLRRAPWSSATVIGGIALGMALATTVFAVVDGRLFKPLPYPNADRLVAIKPGFNHIPASASPSASSVKDLADWQAAAPEAAITGIIAARWPEMGEGVNQPLFGMALVQPNFFDTIGVRPLIGGLAASDFDHDDVVRPVIIAYEVWQSRFHGESNVIGQSYIGDPASGRGFRVVGVMPRGFVFPSDVPVSFIAPYVPPPDALSNPTRRTIGETIARLPPGMSIASPRARVEAGMAATAARVINARFAAMAAHYLRAGFLQRRLGVGERARREERAGRASADLARRRRGGLRELCGAQCVAGDAVPRGLGRAASRAGRPHDPSGVGARAPAPDADAHAV